MIAPTVNNNGTSKKELLAQARAAKEALNIAISALVAMYPNGRDYQTAPEVEWLRKEALHQAMNEAGNRIRTLESILVEVSEIAIAIYNQRG